ncbi:MAG: 4'-phosphopantetheinyl transferase superfamily protein [Bacteroidales bacterium OttesenSCG-928-I14]|jgi:phosphopantetheinyl transferase|nr:4'-phosphopantetheinyl transferase superfamily protein [Bacteroidales bacterium OttesenSCG-928-I14]
MIHIMPTDNSKCRIGVISIDKMSNELLAELENWDWYCRKLRRMREMRKQEWLATRVLLKKLIGEEKEIIYTNSGKPYFRDKQFYIGISHTRGYAAVILNEEKPVSIDIEYISSRIEKIQDRFMNKMEKNNLSQKNPLVHMLLHWSAKETLCKFFGGEKVEFKTQFHINPFEPVIGECTNFTAYETLTKNCQLFTIKYSITKNYVLCFLS